RFVVVSAMSGITNTLIEAARLAASRDERHVEVLETVRERHRTTISELLPGTIGAEVMAAIKRDLADISDVLRAASLLRGSSRDTIELVSGYGEVWSAQILAALLSSLGHDAGWLDARDVLTVSR